MPDFQTEGTELNFGDDNIYAPSFPSHAGLAVHSYISAKPAYTVTNRLHGTTIFTWTTEGVKQTDRDTIFDYWNTTLNEGYDNFTVVDHRYRMLFEASWNDWRERLVKRSGGLYQIEYNVESPIPWTLPTFGCYPMVSDNLINHNLSGDDLTEIDGIFIDNDSFVELTFVETQSPAGTDGLCVAMDGNYLVMFYGMNGTNKHVRTYKYTTAGNATLADEYPDVGGVNTAYQFALDTTKTPKLVFYANNNGGYCLAYDSSGNLTFKSTQAGIVFGRGVTIDTGRNVFFVGDVGANNIKSYPYTDLGVIGALIDSAAAAADNFVCLTIDMAWGLVFGGTDAGLFACSYDTNGDNLTFGAAINAFSYNDGWVAVDATNKRLFSASDNGFHMYSYDSGGVATLKDSDLSIAGGGVSVDVANKFVYVSARGDGVKAFSYTDLATLVEINALDDQGGDYVGNAIDTENNVLACAKAQIAAALDGVSMYKVVFESNVLRLNGYALKLTGT